eukprot:1142033-Pelagomonas_calceolata.AAC.5
MQHQTGAHMDFNGVSSGSWPLHLRRLSPMQHFLRGALQQVGQISLQNCKLPTQLAPASPKHG